MKSKLFKFIGVTTLMLGIGWVLLGAQSQFSGGGGGTFTGGTVTSPILFPDGTTSAPGIAYSGATGTGFSRNATDVVFSIAGTAIGSMNNTNNGGFKLRNDVCYAWAGTTSPTGVDTTTMCVPSNGTVNFGSGTANDGTTKIRAASFSTCATTFNVTPVTVNANVTTDQNLMAFTLPANCLNIVGRTLRIFAAGVYTTPAAATPQITLKVKICSVSGCASGNTATVISIISTAATASATNNNWNLTAWVTTQTAGATGAWEAHGPLSIDLGALTTTADSIFNDVNAATVTGSPSAIDTTAQNFLQVSATFSTNQVSANAITERQLVIDSVN